MGTEVLRPQDFMGDRFGAHTTSFNRRRNVPNLQPNQNNHNKRNFTKPDHQRKKLNRPAEVSRRSPDGGSADARRREQTVPVAVQVTLLRRGESLDSLARKTKENNNNHQKAKSESQIPIGDLAVYGGERIGPESPEMVPTRILPDSVATPTPADIYAGSAFFTSPSPHSLPVPSFFSNNRKNKKLFDDDSATRDLRRMLRLE